MELSFSQARCEFWLPPSTKLTTFITPFERFILRRLPCGISSAPEYFQKRMDKELTSLQRVLCHMDDICVIGRNKEEHDERLVKVLCTASQGQWN